MPIFDRVAELAAWMAATDIDVLVLERAGWFIRLRALIDGERRGCGRCDEVQAAQAVPSNATDCRCEPRWFVSARAIRCATTPLAPAGDRVAAGQALGLLQIGALLLPVSAPRDGVVEATLGGGRRSRRLRRPAVHVVRTV